MWGKERGMIPVNQKTTFGNVLPESVRKFNFSWKGEPSPLEIGRYKAIATLSYGNESKQNSTSITSFWVVPLVPVLSFLGTILLIGLTIAWFVRSYVRRALGVHGAVLESRPSQKTAKILAQPLVDGVMDLRKIAQKKEAEKRMTMGDYVAKYKLFFLFIIVLVVIFFIAQIFFGDVLLPEKNFEIKVDTEMPVPFADE